jgi:hypothetical protein
LHSLEVGQTFRDLHLVDYHKFIAEHAEFLIARTRPTSWMIQALLADGARVELVDYRKGAGTAVEETLMFRVKINGGSVQVLK